MFCVEQIVLVGSASVECVGWGRGAIWVFLNRNPWSKKQCAVYRKNIALRGQCWAGIRWEHLFFSSVLIDLHSARNIKG